MNTPHRHGFTRLRSVELRPGFTLLEVVPVLAIAAFLATIVILALNPVKQYQEARNVSRKHDIALIADAIASYTRDYGATIFLDIPLSPSPPIEICGSQSDCGELLNLNILRERYFDGVPTDPLVEEGSTNSHYFVIRSGRRFTVSAQDTEPAGVEDLSVTR